MLDHPNARSASVCRAIWDASTRGHRESLSCGDLTQLASRPAMNVPEILDYYWRRASALRMRGSQRAAPLLDNQSLRVEAKERVLEGVRRSILRLD